MGRRKKKLSYGFLRRKAYIARKRAELKSAGIPWSPTFKSKMEPEDEASLLEFMNIYYLAEVVDDINTNKVDALLSLENSYVPVAIDFVNVLDSSFFIENKFVVKQQIVSNGTSKVIYGAVSNEWTVCPICGATVSIVGENEMYTLCEHARKIEDGYIVFSVPSHLLDGCFKVISRTKEGFVFYVPFTQKVRVYERV